MKLVDKLVLKDLIPFFAIGIALFTGIWFAADPVIVASRYLSQGVPLPLVLHIVVIYLPPILALTLPMGMLLAVLQGFGRLSGDSEAVAVFAGGIPFARVAAPAAVMGLVASVAGYFISDKVAAAANQEKVNLQQQIGTIIKNPTPGFAQQPLHFENRDKTSLQTLVQIEGGLNLQTKTMRNVTIVVFDHDKPSLSLHAASGQFLGTQMDNFKSWRLYDVDVNKLGPAGSYYHLDDGTTEDLGIAALNQNPEEMALLNREADTLDFAQTRQRVRLMQAAGMNRADVRGAETELWSKIALPFSAFVFTVIGAPLGLRPQRSSKVTGWFLAILIIFGYYVLYTAMGYAARGGGVPPMLAAFLPNLIGLALGGALVWRASR